MSNLQNFIAYKINCPVCNNRLHLSFNSNESNKNIRYEDNSLCVKMEVKKYPMSPTKKISFDVNYNIDFDSNEFTIDFLDRAKNKLPFVSLDKIEAFKNYILSQSTNFYKSCGICKCYMYTAAPMFNYNSSSKITDFDIRIESISLCRPDNEYKNYKLINNYKENKSLLFAGKGKNRDFSSFPPILYTGNRPFGNHQIKKTLWGDAVETPIIKMNDLNIEELIKRLECFITFS